MKIRMEELLAAAEEKDADRTVMRNPEAPPRAFPRVPRSRIAIGILVVFGFVLIALGVGLVVYELWLTRAETDGGLGPIGLLGVIGIAAGVVAWTYAKVGLQLRRSRSDRDAGDNPAGER